MSIRIRQYELGWKAIAVTVLAIFLLIAALFFGASWLIGSGGESEADMEATLVPLLGTNPAATVDVAVPPVSSASLVLGPPAGAPAETVTITGAGFPPNSAISLQIGPATGANAQTFAETTADASGAVVYPFTVPATYPDGTTITDPQLVVVAITTDGTVSASATMDFMPTGGDVTTDDTTVITDPAAADSGTFATYTSDVLLVSFQYPVEWMNISTEPDSYEGTTGWFSASAAGSSGATLQEMCDLEAQQGTLPYGTAPTVQYIDVSGMPACLIMPSADQGVEWGGQAALIVTYPTLVQIDGQTYQFLVLYGDQLHLLDPISTTLTFLSQ